MLIKFKIIFLILIFNFPFISGKNSKVTFYSERVALIDSIQMVFEEIRKDFKIINYKLDSIQKQRNLIKIKENQIKYFLEKTVENDITMGYHDPFIIKHGYLIQIDSVKTHNHDTRRSTRIP